MTANCWFWLGSVSHNGYGRFYVNGHNLPAQKVAWELENDKPFPVGKDGTHSCDTPGCVRPDHIVPGTDLENSIDALMKGSHTGTAKRVFQTHCKRGHALTPDNVRLHGEGYRQCRTCEDARIR